MTRVLLQLVPATLLTGVLLAAAAYVTPPPPVHDPWGSCPAFGQSTDPLLPCYTDHGPKDAAGVALEQAAHAATLAPPGLACTPVARAAEYPVGGVLELDRASRWMPFDAAWDATGRGWTVLVWCYT